MSSSEAPKRLHYGWVIALAHVAFMGGFFGDLMLYPASRGVFDFAWSMTVVATIPASIILCIWLAVVWLVYGPKRPWHGRTWVALLPSLFIVASAVFHASSYSREEHMRKIFYAYFAAEIPPDAKEMDVSAPTLADSGNKAFVFRCSKESTLGLIKAMKVELQQGEPSPVTRLALDWSDERWRDARAYERVDDEGTQNRLITGSSMESVLVTRWPDWAKPTRESDQKSR